MAQGKEQSYLEKLDAAHAQGMEASVPEPGESPSIETPVTPEAESPGLVDAFVDTAKGLAGGVESAGRGMMQTGIAGANAVLKAATPSFLRDLTPQIPDPYGEGGSAKPLIEDPKFTINKFAKDATSLGIGMIAGSKALNSLREVPAAASSVVEMMKTQFVGSVLVRDAHAERVSNWIEENPHLSNRFTSWLAADEKDTVAEGKFKAALEDTLTVPVAAVVFKSLGLAYKATKGTFQGRKVEEVAQELETEIQALNENPPVPEKYNGNIDRPLLLNRERPTETVETPAQKVMGFEEVNIKDLKTRTEDHAGPIVPEKVAGLREAIKTPERLAPITVDEDAAGARFIVDGRHRTAAAEAEGFTSITAKVVKSKDSIKLGELQAEAGSPKKLDALAAKAEKAREMFNLTPEQFTSVKDTLVSKIKEMRSDPNVQVSNLFTESLPEGAFNYTKMANRADVHFTLQNLAEVIAPNLEANVKSVQGFREIQATANLFGAKPDVMMANLRSWGVDAKNMAPTMIAAKGWAQSLAQEIYRDAQSIAITGVGGQSAQIEMLRKVSVLADIEGMLKSLQTAAARTTAAGRIRTTPRYSGEQMLKLLDEEGGADRIAKLAQKLALTEGKPEQIAGLLRVSWIRKAIDTHNELWINALLSGISTHVVNVSTAASQLVVKPLNKTLGSLATGDIQGAKEAVAHWRALGSVYRDAFSLSRRSFEMERPILSITDKQLEINPTISAGNYGLNPEKWLGQGVNYLGKVTRLTSRFLGSEDELFKQLSYRADLMVQAERDAADMVRAGKIKPENMVERVIDGKTVKVSEYDAYVREKFNEGFSYETLPDGSALQGRGTNEAALQYSGESTFTQSLKVPTWIGNRSFAETLYQAANSHPVLRGTVLPFVKVPANLFREGVSYTPVLAQLRKQFWHDVMVEGGQRRAEALGKMATGSMILGSAAYLAVDGRITGAAPEDKDIRGRMYEKGWQPYSFVFSNSDGTNTYVPFARFDPYGMVFGIVADFAQTAQHMNEGSRHSLPAMLTMSLANLMNSKGYLKGLVDAVDILHGGQGEAGLGKMERIMQSWTASHVPAILKLGETSQEIKEIRSMMDAILAKTPGFSSMVPSKRGYFGDKVMAPVGWPFNSLSPVKPSTETSDPALLELARLADGPAKAQFGTPEAKLGTINLYDFKNSEGVTAYERLMTHLNEGPFHEEVNRLVQTEKYQNGTDGDGYYHIGSKVVEIKKLERTHVEKARKAMLNEFPELKELVREDKKNENRMKHGRDTEPINRLLEVND